MKTKYKIFLLTIFFALFGLAQISQAASDPIILYTDITSGPNTGGENNNGAYLSIFGFNFGNNIDNVTVTIGGGQVARKMYLGASLGRPDVQQLSVQLGSAAQTGAIKVSVSGVDSNTDHIFTVRAGDFYYMSKTGNDSTGVVNDINHPYRTANYVATLSAFNAGDFLVIRGGTYDLSSGQENVYLYRWLQSGIGNGGTKRSGTAASPITVYGYPGEEVVIDFGSTVGGQVYTGIKQWGDIEYFNYSNIIFDLRDTGGIAMYLGFYSEPLDNSNNDRVVNIRVKGGMYRVGAGGGVNAIMLHRVENLKFFGVDVGNQSQLTDPLMESHVIYLSHWYTNAEIAWNYIHDNPYGRAALQIAGDPWGPTPYQQGTTWGMNTNVRVHDNLFQNLPEAAVLMNIGSFEVYFYNNIINNACTRLAPGFSPVAIRGARLNEGKYYLYNNTIYTDAPAGGIIQMGYSPQTTYPESVTLYNNIVYAKNSSSNYYQINHSSFQTSQITSNNNLWYNSSQGVPTWEGANGKNVNPQFVNLAGNNFHLQSSSPAIDAATNLVSAMVNHDYDFLSRPQGSAFDIGAYEYAGESASDTTPPSAPLGLTVN